MGYFANGAIGMDYEAQWCERCIHEGGPEYEDGGCAVWLAHMEHNYAECNNPNGILHILIPRKNGENQQCRMFVEKTDGQG